MASVLASVVTLIQLLTCRFQVRVLPSYNLNDFPRINACVLLKMAQYISRNFDNLGMQRRPVKGNGLLVLNF